MDRQQVTLLVLLDLSAAFDTINHQVLLSRLRLSFGIRGYALESIASYLSGRTQRVSFENNFSQSRYLSCGVPQGSCLGPLLFTMYASKLSDIIKGHLPRAHAYADDSQLYLSFKPDNTSSQSNAVDAMERCIRAIRCWMIKDKLKVNDIRRIRKYLSIKTPHKHSFVHLSPHVLIIVMVCCMVYQPRISTSCNVFRTAFPDLFVPFLVFVI